MPSAGVATIAPIFQQLAEGYWSAREFGRVMAILSHVRAVAAEAPRPENRAAMAQAAASFFTAERLKESIAELTGEIEQVPPDYSAKQVELDLTRPPGA